MQCDVTDLQGNHCPEEAAHTVVFKGVETHLCERCHVNVLAGAYGSHLTPRALDLGESAAFLALSTPEVLSTQQAESTPAPNQ